MSLEVKEENKEFFRRTVRTLLTKTNIPKEILPELFDYAADEENRQMLSEYFDLMGFDIDINEQAGNIRLIPAEDLADTARLRQAGRVPVPKAAKLVMMVLWKHYLEKMTVHEEIWITYGQLIDSLNNRKIKLSKPDISRSLQLFKDHNLIGYSDQSFNEDTRIRIYTSVLFNTSTAGISKMMQDLELAAGKREKKEATGDEG